MPRDGTLQEIVAVKRRRGAKEVSLSSVAAPPAAIGAAKSRKKRAIDYAVPSRATPASSPISREAGGDGHISRVIQLPCAIAATVSQIVDLQRTRRFCIKAQSQCDRSIEAFIASSIGYRIDADEADRKAVFKRAAEIRRGAEKILHDDQALTIAQGGIVVAPFLRLMILQSAASRLGWDERRLAAEKEMRRLVRGLPVAVWAAGIKGFGELGLAIIIGEAGIPIGDYRSVSGLWKRLGLAVIDGERQRKKTSVDEAARHGYNPKRRAEVWAVADSMFRHQWAGAKEDTPAHAVGPYGEVYGRRKAHTLPRIAATADLAFTDLAKWTPKRCDNDARRVMTKALLCDLWVEWRRRNDCGA